MKATFNQIDELKFNVSHRKEKHFREQFTATVFNGEFAYDAVILRIYASDAKSYCCVWIHDNCSWDHSERNYSLQRQASGSAGGYGYHSASAAAQIAINNAGIELSEDINGRGDYAIEEAVQAIAKALWNGDQYYIHISHSHA